jgi:hypothetical protein
MIARQTGQVRGEFRRPHAKGKLRSTDVHGLRAGREGIAMITRSAA